MIQRNASLRKYNTFGIECQAEFLFTIKSESEAFQALREIDLSEKKYLILGGGSNILFTGDFNGIIIHPVIDGIAIEEDNPDHVIVSAGAGEEWDKLVDWAVTRNLAGLENLSLIPGMVGAAPVQNIGAYGVEAADVITSVRAISLIDGSLRSFENNECRFVYRESIFKGELKKKYLITKVFLRLDKTPDYKLDYGFLREEIAATGDLSLKAVRDTVIRIRRSKLPDPRLTGNAGSFFKNPVIENEEAEKLKYKYPLVPLYPDTSGRTKVAAGWLVEQCGWKGKRIGDAGVHSRQALVLVNHGNAKGHEILDLSEEIRSSVIEKFGISLEREVEVI